MDRLPRSRTRSTQPGLTGPTTRASRQSGLVLVATPNHNLPAEISSFIGRADQVDQLLRLLARTRLLTLVGTAGVGKSRLAVRVGGEVHQLYPDGVWLVELDLLTDPNLLPLALAAVLELREQSHDSAVSQLRRFLAPKRALLILDNCEHLLHSCAALIERLLQGAPQLQILATSREAMGIPGETSWSVPPLSAPALTASESLQHLMRYEAVQLFIDRAAATETEFHLSIHNASAVAEICRRLDGIPLAIELAAARVSLLTPVEIAARLSECFKLLTSAGRTAPQRHQTLHGALQWSYDLLTDTERLLFQRLAVFAGGWSLDAAQNVCAAGRIDAKDVLELVGRLVATSLVVAHTTDGAAARYRMLETVRQYGREKLAAAGGEPVAFARYADYFVALAEQVFSTATDPADPGAKGGSQHAVTLRLDQERANLRAALRWCIENGEVDRGLQLGGAAANFWLAHGSPGEGREWLEAMMQLLQAPQSAQAATRGRALYLAGVLATMLGDQPVAQALLEENLAIRRELGKPIGMTLMTLGRVAWRSGNYVKARTLMEESVAIAQRDADRIMQARTLGFLGQLMEEQGEYEAASTSYTDSLAVYRELGSKAGMAEAFSQLGLTALAAGKSESAGAFFEQSLALAREANDSATIAWGCLGLGLVRIQQLDWADARRLIEENLRIQGYLQDQRRIPRSLAGLAIIHAACGKPDRAFRLFGAAMALRNATRRPELAWSGPPFDRATIERWEPSARAVLGEDSASAAYAAGTALSMEDAIREALNADEPVHAARDTAAASLTSREIEVVQLLAAGHSNREIAEILVIALSTAERHVANILSKLSLRTRGQVAVWAVTSGAIDTSNITPRA